MDFPGTPTHYRDKQLVVFKDTLDRKWLQIDGTPCNPYGRKKAGQIPYPETDTPSSEEVIGQVLSKVEFTKLGLTAMTDKFDTGSIETGHDPTQSNVAAVIDWSIRNQLLVIVGAITLIVAGWLAVLRTPLDAIPDLSDTQVIIRTDFVGQSPQIVEDLVTYPLSTAMLGLPKTEDVRGYSMFGTSFV